jgi:hypothetical protein
VVRTAALRLALLAVLVALAHLVALEWAAREVEAVSGLKAMVPPMYTRLLKPSAPPPVVASVQPAPPAAPRARAAPRPKRPASAPKRGEREETPPPEPAPPAPEAAERADPIAQAAEEAASQPAPAASAPTQAASAPVEVAAAPAPAASASLPSASAPASAASAAEAAQAALDQWPADSRLSYRLDGEWRSGRLYGDARVLWQREGSHYQVRLEVRIQLFGTQVLTSQGEVTPQGLVPRVYEELRPGKRRMAQLGDQVVVLENGTTVPRPPGVQDTASQFVELTQRFAMGKEPLAVGRTVTVWLARPGGVDRWTYDVVEREILQTPRLGPVEAFHLKPRPIANPRGNITAEMWFAPSLQYLPVRIKVVMAGEAWMDLVVDQIEQR